MTSRDHSEQLDRIIEQEIEGNGLHAFGRYWDLYKRTANISIIRRFFVRTEPRLLGGGYCNVAIIGDDILVDIEGDDNDNSGALSLHLLKSISGVVVHSGSLPGVASSQGASLVVLAEREGVTELGFHWVAKTTEEEERLLGFTEFLVQVVSTR